MKKALELIGLLLFLLGGCMLNSDGIGFTIAICMCLVGIGLIALMEYLFV